MKLYNTLTRQIEELKPLNPSSISLYTCGPTVYDYTHIGHAKAYVINDLLKRVLIYNGYHVSHVMNITDVGHLSGDDDSGEDKLEKGAKKYKKDVWDIVKFYTDYFFKTIDALNILRPNITCKATDHIDYIINMIKILQDKGYVYETKEALYFDTSKLTSYGQLSGQALDDKLKGVRSDVYVDPQKKNNTDFALWFKQVGRFANHTMHWDSPWGEGFPGWHIECSAMSQKYLGDTIDIHTGGIDHIPVHHENEIAQSEGATGKPFVKIWFHYNFLMVDNQKMSKSLGNIYTIDDIAQKNIDPLALRYLFLQSHYRQLSNFTWNSLKSSQEAYFKLKRTALDLKPVKSLKSLNSPKALTYQKQFIDNISNDLQIPQAVAIMWEMIKSDISNDEKFFLLMDFDKIFGLNLGKISIEKIPLNIIKLADQRLEARKVRNFDMSDRLRIRIEKAGYKIKDIDDSYKIIKS